MTRIGVSKILLLLCMGPDCGIEARWYRRKVARTQKSNKRIVTRDMPNTQITNAIYQIPYNTGCQNTAGQKFMIESIL